jgi:hypothetical protein
LGDLTEIEFARTYFDGWEHWQMICALSWFKPYLARWRQELELQVKAKALNEIIAVSKNKDHKSSYEANKWLIAGHWKEDKKGAGRPSKEEIKRQAQELFLSKADTEDDLKRVTN